ncbi:DUF58 domain-containing protein [Leifsonia sp. F6_8S_P_1B]|uniref:DUF58 domain-containing protein n=1 Tax=Leifsonia williamsii TaxID=3035919 RepID=A0ABT8KBH2_9MICO|nr:DUF58 domain-containing protein [Leifsonia williamsii]MDN4614338.1 DUF58 domain-containing protein [Leifsonia williamsii]
MTARARGPERSRPIGAPGAATLAVAVVLVAGGLVAGWLELVVPGLALLALLVTGALMTIGRSAYDVRVDLTRSKVRVGERAIGRIVVLATGSRRSAPSLLTLPVGANAADFELPGLSPGQEFDESFIVPTARRGVVRVGPVVSRRGDPLGLLRRTVTWTEQETIHVHPRTVRLPLLESGRLRDLEGDASGDIADSGLSFHALREYVPGDDRRSVHWRASARLGNLMVRQYDDLRRTRLAIGLALDEWEYASAAEFELAVSAFASLGVAAVRGGTLDGVFAGTTTLGRPGEERLLDAGAAVAWGDGGGLSDVLRGIRDRAATATAIVVITGSRVERRTVFSLASRFGHPAPVTVLACEEGVAVRAAAQGATAYRTLGRLTDLPLALASGGAR